MHVTVMDVVGSGGGQGSKSADPGRARASENSGAELTCWGGFMSCKVG